MAYSPRLAETLKSECDTAWKNLLILHTKFSAQGEKLAPGLCQQYILFGVGRRFDLLGNALRNIFKIFPPDRTTNLTRLEMADLTINLHAFILNVAGCFDNMAWAFVYRHNLLDAIGNRTKIGLFRKETSRYFPDALRVRIASTEVQAWLSLYLTEYRDALAHRIPLYVPPAEFTNEDADRYRQLNADKTAALLALDPDRAERCEVEQRSLGRPCFFLMNSNVAPNNLPPVHLHMQVIGDTVTVTELGNIFLANWHQHVERA